MRIALAMLALWIASAASAATVRVVDDAGLTVELAQPAARIVSLSPHLTEQLFAIGAGDRVVGVSEFSDYPSAARSLPRVARSASVDLERIAALRPDLIVLWGSGYPPTIAEAVRRLGAPVFVSEPRQLADIASSMHRLAQLTGHHGTPRAAEEFATEISRLRQTYGARKPVRVFYQIWDAPLMTLSGRHVLNEAIELCGGRNVFAELLPIAPQVSIEAVVAADPELIVTAEPAGRPSEALTKWSAFPRVTAVRRRQLVTLDADKIHRHGPRLPHEIGALCSVIDRSRQR